MAFNPHDPSTFALHPYAAWRVAIARTLRWLDEWWFWGSGTILFIILTAAATEWWQRLSFGLFAVIEFYSLLARLLRGKSKFLKDLP